MGERWSLGGRGCVLRKGCVLEGRLGAGGGWVDAMVRWWRVWRVLWKDRFLGLRVRVVKGLCCGRWWIDGFGGGGDMLVGAGGRSWIEVGRK